MLTIQERWRFESIPNQLVIYSLHKPHSPAKVRYWSPSQLSRNLEFARNHMYPGADRLPFGLIIAPPCPTTPAPVQCVAGNLLGPNNLPASRLNGTFFGQLNVRHAFNMTRGTSNDRSLINTDGITTIPHIRLRPVSIYSTLPGYVPR